MRYLAISVLLHSLFLFALKTIGVPEFPARHQILLPGILHLTLVSGQPPKSLQPKTLLKVKKEPKKFPLQKGESGRENRKAKEGDWTLYTPAPPYPKQAKEKGWEGEVVLELKTDQAGYVGSLKILSGSGYQLLDEEAYKAIKGWRLAPELFARIPIVFRLRE